jgi:hypothetical protein
MVKSVAAGDDQLRKGILPTCLARSTSPSEVHSWSLPIPKKNWAARKQEFKPLMDMAEQGCLRWQPAQSKMHDVGKLGQQFRRQIRCGIMGGIFAGRITVFALALASP